MLSRFYFFLSFALALSGCSKDSDDEDIAPVVNCTNATPADLEKIQLFPASHPLNTDISNADKDPKSDAIMAFLADGNPGLKADFGSGLYEGAPIGIPFVVVCNDQPKIEVNYKGDDYDDDYGDESDPGPYPIPLNTPIEGNGEEDSHVLGVDIDNKKLYELYNANTANGKWEASSGAIFDLTKEEYRTAGFTSADAAGLPILPLLVRYEEVASGTIDHAIRFTLPKSKVMKGYVFPARHLVKGGNNNAATPVPFGMRLRLRKDFNVSGFSASNQTILNAMKKYGIIMADIGSSFYVTGAPDERWNNDDLQKLKNVKATDFEVVKMGAIITN